MRTLSYNSDVLSQELRRIAAGALVVIVVLIVGAQPVSAQTTGALTGPFALTAGTCAGGSASGSYFRMVQPSGTAKDGPFVTNGDSTCADQTYTLLSPGTDGGFTTGSYQPAPSQPFDAAGNSLAARIVVPTPFFGVRFGLSTDPTDRQTGKQAPALSLRTDGGKLSGDARAWAATWNKQDFNQGAPKPDGSSPGLTTAVHGTFDESSGAFVVEWASTVVGGPFNDFTGVWHLAGTFRPAAAASIAAPATGGAAPSASTGRSGGQATPGVAGATPAAEVPTEVAGVTVESTVPPSGGGTQLVGAVAEKGWLPPSWLIVLTAVLGMGAALTLIRPRPDAARDDDPTPPEAPVELAGVLSPKRQDRSRARLFAALAIGLGLAAAPAAFQMFTRAPKGGDMIESFKPYMRTAKIDAFSAFLRDIDGASAESSAAIAALPPAEQAKYPGIAALNREWPTINGDMGDMLTTMRADIPNYEGIAALPPFVLFPWFFVLPGLMIAGVAGWMLLADRHRPPAAGRVIALAALGVGLIAAPAVFQMFTRAPGGAEMINDFKPLMTDAKVNRVQGYFLTIGLAEGELRNKLVPAEAAQGRALPASSALSAEWPQQSGDMAPMIAAMADNLDNFKAVVALPPFWLFPWFFVLPGVLVALLAVFSYRSVQEDGSVTRLIGFPNPVNEVSARLVATGVVVMSVAAVAFNAQWILPILCYGFVARVMTGPKLSPLGQLVTRHITPRLPFREKLVAGPPKRFAQGMGVAFSGAALLLALTDHWFAAQVVLGLLILAASLEAFLGLCLGCKIFAGLMRLGIIPEDVCEACNNVGLRLQIDAAEQRELVAST